MADAPLKELVGETNASGENAAFTYLGCDPAKLKNLDRRRRVRLVR